MPAGNVFANVSEGVISSVFGTETVFEAVEFVPQRLKGHEVAWRLMVVSREKVSSNFFMKRLLVIAVL
jgi:hypothetical protein